MDIGNKGSPQIIFQGLSNDTKFVLNRVLENPINPNHNLNPNTCNLVVFQNLKFSKYTHEFISDTDIQFLKI